MSDLSQTIAPKSDQLNTDDLISGPRTITVTRVTVALGSEQPVSVYFEGDGGKPFKPCLSMRRVLVIQWGPDGDKYVGRSMVLCRDPKVTWSGAEVGGIRISHLSDIPADAKMALTQSRKQRGIYTVRRLERPAASQTGASPKGPAKERGDLQATLSLIKGFSGTVQQLRDLRESLGAWSWSKDERAEIATALDNTEVRDA